MMQLQRHNHQAVAAKMLFFPLFVMGVVSYTWESSKHEYAWHFSNGCVRDV